jgi:acyl-CoA thioester hydrolase
MPTDFAYRHRLSVRFRDCDAMGHVNHAVYLTYFEQCRLTFWREATGTPTPHTRVIIARAECDYRAPAHFGDELEVRLNVAAIGRSSFTLGYEIVQAVSGQLVADGRTVMVSYDYAAGAPIPLPDATRALLEQLKVLEQLKGSDPNSSKGSDPGQTRV